MPFQTKTIYQTSTIVIIMMMTAGMTTDITRHTGMVNTVTLTLNTLSSLGILTTIYTIELPILREWDILILNQFRVRVALQYGLGQLI